MFLRNPGPVKILWAVKSPASFELCHFTSSLLLLAGKDGQTWLLPAAGNTWFWSNPWNIVVKLKVAFTKQQISGCPRGNLRGV